MKHVTKAGWVKTKSIPTTTSSIGVERMWKQEGKGKGVVAVIDTGVKDHIKLPKIEHINLTSEQGVREDHGTHVSGIIHNVAPECSIIDIKILTSTGGNISDIVKAIDIAMSKGVRVINMSLGTINITPTEKLQLSSSIKKAWNQGVICVCASGNEGVKEGTKDAFSYPASIPDAISVGSCLVSGSSITLSPFSNENDMVDITAPGSNIYSTVGTNGYAVYSGTSMAAPHISGALACMFSNGTIERSSRGSSYVFSKLTSPLNIIDCGIPGKDISYGVGFFCYHNSF